MNAWMVHGPFNLVGTSDAELNYYLWREITYLTDAIFVGASTDGNNFSGESYAGSSGEDFLPMSLDLSTLCGQSQVWVAFVFQSDTSVTDYGAFIDDVVLRKYVSGGTAPQITSISPGTGPAGTGFQVTIYGSNFGATQGTSGVSFWRGGGYPEEEASIVSWSDTEIVCEVPSGASSGTTGNGVRVTTGAGPSNNYPFTVTFSYSGDKWFGANPMEEPFEINENTSDTTGEGQAVRNAAQTWNDVDGANFSFVDGGSTSATAVSGNGHNEIMWVSDTGGSIATSWRWYYPSTGEIYECDIEFDDGSYDWYANGSPSLSQMDVQNIAVHELGHWLCLLDMYGSGDSAKTMYGYAGAGQTNKRDLEAEDKAGIRWIYSDWDSYNTGYPDDSGVQNDTFSDSDTEHVVFMYGTGFSSTYDIIYWDGDGNKVATDANKLSVSGALKSSREFVDGQDAAGDWHATVYTGTAPASSYSAADLDIIADDTSYTGGYAFHVEQTAIPEFPTTVTAIVALALCAGIYLWMRRKAAPVQA